MFNLSEWLENNLIDAIKERAFIPSQGRILAYNYKENGKLSDAQFENIIVVADEVEAQIIAEQEAENNSPIHESEYEIIEPDIEFPEDFHNLEENESRGDSNWVDDEEQNPDNDEYIEETLNEDITEEDNYETIEEPNDNEIIEEPDNNENTDEVENELEP